MWNYSCFFFFQAEDGIRDLYVTGVQTCALPILDRAEDEAREQKRLGTTGRGIGPTYVDKARRIGLRVGDLLKPVSFREKVRFLLDRKYHELAAVGIARPDADAI